MSSAAGSAAWAELAVAVGERLVDHVPRVDPALVAAHDLGDVGLHPGQQDLLRGRGGAVQVEPGRGAVVLGPDQAMADDLEVLAVREGHELIGQVEIPAGFRRTDRGGLHAVLRGDMAELGSQQRPILGRSGIRSDRPTPDAQGEASRKVWAEPKPAERKNAQSVQNRGIRSSKPRPPPSKHPKDPRSGGRSGLHRHRGNPCSEPCLPRCGTSARRRGCP